MVCLLFLLLLLFFGGVGIKNHLANSNLVGIIVNILIQWRDGRHS